MEKNDTPLISICIPCYNRAQFLPELLDSILSQSFVDYEIVLAEDQSPERDQITAVIESYQVYHSDRIRYFLNTDNLGYDRNVRNLVELSKGNYIFFLGNDDLLAPNALSVTADILTRYSSIGMILKSYAWFSSSPDELEERIYYYRSDRYFGVLSDRLKVGVRRAGVLSGLILRREPCIQASTDQYDGSLYYQIYLAASVLVSYDLYYTRQILVYSRNTETPDFGNSNTESQIYTPGCYTPRARLSMISSSLRISKDICASKGLSSLYYLIASDYAIHIYPFIRDQLHLPPSLFFPFYIRLSRLDIGRYPLFHLFCFLHYLLGQSFSDRLLAIGRKLFRLGRTV